MNASAPSPARDYPRLFAAMNQALRVLSTGGDEEEALRRSFDNAAAGFGAEKALLLRVARQAPLALRSIAVRGLSAAQVGACERGESVRGVSASVIRSAIASRRPTVVEHPYLRPDQDETPALAGQSYSVLCAPILDPLRGLVLAVLYFQNAGDRVETNYREQSDLVWIEGYTSVLGQAFALHFQEQAAERERDAQQPDFKRRENAPELIGSSAHTQALRRLLHEVLIPAADATDPDPLLILGEKGTGKDLVARYLHAYSARAEQPFVVVNCAEISDELAAARFFGHKKGAFSGALADEEGLFRAAHRGVLFLDEVGELSLRAQGTLLRVLENRAALPVGGTREIRVDVQVILASNRDLDLAAARGEIKPDLLDRFRTQVVRLTPLRERPWDVPALVQHFIGHHERRTRKRTLGLDQDALRALASYSWPGNVRELDRVCSLLVTRARPGARLDRGFVTEAYPELQQTIPTPRAAAVLSDDVSLRQAVRAFQRELILARLERHNWDVRAVRESLRLPKTTFRRYALGLGIEWPRRSEEGEPGGATSSRSLWRGTGFGDNSGERGRDPDRCRVRSERIEGEVLRGRDGAG